MLTFTHFLKRRTSVKKILFIAMLFMCDLGVSASAQLTTTITVKNTTASTMYYNTNGSTQPGFIGTASPSPVGVVIPAGDAFTFVITSPYPDIATAHFYFQNADNSEGCRFDTSYTTAGSWTIKATSSDRTAIPCSAKLTVNDFFGTHDYSVLFTL